MNDIATFWASVLAHVLIAGLVLGLALAVHFILARRRRAARELPMTWPLPRTDKASPFAKATPPPRRTIKRRPREKKKGGKK